MRGNPAAGIRLECDLYAPVKAYLEAQGWRVKAEVEGADAAAMRDGQLLMAELKLTLNLDVILQAVGCQRTADVVYVAVPRKAGAMRSRRWLDTLELLKRLNLGLLVVSVSQTGADVEELVEPAAQAGRAARGRAVRRRVRVLREMDGRTGDWNTGGVRGRKLVTAYREAALRLAAMLQDAGPLRARDLKPAGETSARTYRLLRDNHYGWFRSLQGARFELTDEGRAALQAYGEIVSGQAQEPDEDRFSGTVTD